RALARPRPHNPLCRARPKRFRRGMAKPRSRAGSRAGRVGRTGRLSIGSASVQRSRHKTLWATYGKTGGAKSLAPPDPIRCCVFLKSEEDVAVAIPPAEMPPVMGVVALMIVAVIMVMIISVTVESLRELGVLLNQ